MRTATTTALLDGLIDSANEEAWREFDARYRPIIVSFARALDLRVEDAADVAQETLVRFLKEYRAGKYDRSRGRLHSWLIGIAKHCVGDQRHARARRREQRGLSALADLPGDHRLTEIWEAEYQRAMLRRGMSKLREETKTDQRTIRAFELIAFDQRSPTEVAAVMGMTLNDVYLAKHRCLKHLRTILERQNRTYDFT